MISRLVNFLRAASVSVVSVKNSKYEIITTLYFLQQTTNNSVRLIAQSPTCFKLTEYHQDIFSKMTLITNDTESWP